MLAIDLGGTRIKACMVEHRTPGEVVVVEHAGVSLETALTAVGDIIERLAAAGCGSVGLCVPGVVDEEGRVVALPGKLEGAVGADLVGWLHERTGGSAFVINDAVAAGVGEAHDEPGRTVVMTIGTGVGTCVIEGGRPLGRGPFGGGLLSGQLPLTADGPLDTSDRNGTVEAWCRASRITEEARAAGCDAASVEEVFRAAAAGESAAVRGVASYQGWLARGIAALCLAHAPDVVVVGGGPVRADGFLLDGVQALVDSLLWSGQRVVVRPARLGDAAGLVGLAVLAE